jgi:hypothetical protein
MLRNEDFPGYDDLFDVLARAALQAAAGKGRERHAQDLPFADQPMQQLIRLYGPGFALGQAAKKSQEAMRMTPERAVAELLGAIVYIAGVVVAIEASMKETGDGPANDNGKGASEWQA